MDLSGLALRFRYRGYRLLCPSRVYRMSEAKHWNPELYEAKHAFVWNLGRGLVELLNPVKGERILDLGCGTGQLTNEIAKSGADVLGLDSSPDMIGQARQNYPTLRFVLADAREITFEHEFDAIFSNAALHWMLDAPSVACKMAQALKPGGRLVAEMGGKGNVRQIESALHSVLPPFYSGSMPDSKTYFPSVAEYSTILENAGLEVRRAELFDRPTPLDGDRGMADWLRQFVSYYFEDLPPKRREEALEDVVTELRGTLFRDNRWSADYRRLRITAVKA